VAPLDYHGPHGASVGTTSSVLIPAGSFSRALNIQTFPDAPTNVYLRADSSAAVVKTGILCQGMGGAVTFGGLAYPMPTGDVTAIADGGGPVNVMISGG